MVLVRMKKENDLKLLDNIDWAAIGIAVCGIVLFIHLLWGI